MPIFNGFSAPRYQEHDTAIKQLVTEFNNNKSLFISSSTNQASNIPDLSEALVKSWLIEVSGGNDSRSLAAWKIDPAQVNVPGDWSAFKQTIGLSAPSTRNEGTLDQNLKSCHHLACQKRIW